MLMLVGIALGVLMLTIQPVGAQNLVTHSDEVKEHSTDEVRLAALEPDRTQVSDRWELVTDVNDPAGAPGTDFPDYRHFNIDRMSGVLTFKTPPDYENPRSMAADTATNLADKNVYKVKAKFGDGEKYLAVEVTVQVTGEEEDGTITLSNRRPQVGVGLTATLSDPDKGIRTPDWQWQVETGEGTGVFEDIANAVNRTYTPQAGDVGKHLKATANYQDGHDVDYVEEYAVSEFVVRAAPGSNDAPEFQETDEDTGVDADGIQTSRRIEENSVPGTKVGPAVKATDDDHLPAGNPGGEPRDEITYSLRDPAGAANTVNTTGRDDDNDPNTPSDRDGHAAMFSIDQATGQITTRAHLNRESLDRAGTADDYTYSAVVKATDPSGAEGEANLTIHVLDVEETPQLRGPAALTYFENQPSQTITVNTVSVDRGLLLYRDPTQSTEDVPDPPLPRPDDETEGNRVVYMAADNDLDDVATDDLSMADIQWELTGPDAARFQFVGATGTYTNSAALTNNVDIAVDAGRTPAVATSPVLRFRSKPSVAAPADVGGTRGDNIYEVTVRAWDDDWLIGSRDVTIRVADTDNPGTVTLSHITPQQGVEITATLSDPDDVSGRVSWQWYTGAGANTGSEIAGATSDTFTPTDQTSTLSVKATYEDRGSLGQERTAMADTVNDVRTDPIIADTGENADPKFYVDSAGDLTTEANRAAGNVTSTYTRYVLEGEVRNVRNKESADPDENDGARGYEDDAANENDAAAAVKVWDGYYADAEAKTNGTLSQDGTNGRSHLQYNLSGAGAENFEINQNPGTTNDPAGLIRTKRALDFETKSSYMLTVTATDPAGGRSTATVTINVLDQAEIEDVPGDEKRVWVNEGDYDIYPLKANNPPDVNLGGLKWSLLNANEPTDPAPPANNRNDVRSVDCQFDATNDNLCDDFRLYPYNTANSTLLFAIGTGEDHNAPDFETPNDVVGSPSGETSDGQTTFNASGQEAMDNVYQVRVRVAFATLRSDGQPNHPNPAADEMDERTYVVRVVDVDEAPSFAGDDSDQSIDENSDDDLPGIMINRDVGGSVTAMDPEDTSMPDPNKKLTFSLSLPGAYSNMFHIVPSTGEILTRSRIDYEALDLEEQGTPGGQYKSITGVTVTVMDSSGMQANMATLPVSINVRDVNETPVAAQPVAISGDAAVADYAENQDDTTVGTYTVSGDNAATVTWSLGGADMGLFELDDGSNDMERVLKFKATPDFEDPMGGANDDSNTYMVTIQAMHDADDTASRAVTITVTNAEEDGTVTLRPMLPSVGTEITATVTDLDIVDQSSVVWTWARSDAMDGTFTNMSGATSANYTPVDGDAGMYLRATASYTDGYGSDSAMMVTDGAVTVNAPPSFPNAAETRSIAENTAADTSIGAPVAATDPDGDTLTYSLEGTDATSFSVDSGTGQLRTSAALDYESKSTYSVMVKATDPDDLYATADVTINVTDVNEDVPMAVKDYDTNLIPGIQIGELFEAIDDYFDGEIDIDELFEVIDAYFANNG